MTSNSHEKLRAVFLSVLMVVSVFGATVALSGSAAAAANELSVNPNPAGDVSVTVSAQAGNAGNDLSFAIDSDGDDEITQDEQIATVTSDAETGEGSTSFVTSEYVSDGNGDYTVYVAEGSEYPSAVADYDEATTLTIDGDVPSVSGYEITNDDPTSDSGVEVTFGSNEQLETVEATVSGAENATLTLTDEQFTETRNDDGSYTYTATYTAETDGEYTITLDTAADALGNDGADGQSDSVTVDTTDPEGSIPVPAEEVTISDPTTETLQVGYEYTDEFPDIAQIQLVDSDDSATYTWGIQDSDYVDDGTKKTVTLDLTDFDSSSEGADGSAVEDSTYAIQVVATDEVSNTNTISQDGENVRVDTTAPEFSSPELDTSSTESTFSIDIDDNPATSAIADDTTGVDEDSAELTVIHLRDSAENDVLLSNEGIESDGVSWDGQSNTLTFTPGDAGIEYPEDGDLVFDVEAADNQGNLGDTSVQFTVNAETPSMTTETDAADDTVTVTFSDPVDAADGDLSADDFTYEDVREGDASAVDAVIDETFVEDSEGDQAIETATLRLNNDVGSNDLGSDLIGVRENAIVDSDDADSYVSVAGVPLSDTTAPDAPFITAGDVNIQNADSYSVDLDLRTAEPGSVDVTLTGPNGTAVSQTDVPVGASDTFVSFDGQGTPSDFNVSDLDDGTVTIDVTRTDAGGNTEDASTTVTKDTDAPSIDSAQADAGTSDVYVTFDEEVGYFNEFDIAVTAGDGTDITVDEVEDLGDNEYRLELADDLTAADFDDSAASVSTSDVTDLVGNDVDNEADVTDRSTIEFTGLQAEVDSDQVTVEFDESAFANADATGALNASDFAYVNNTAGGASAVESVDHTAGSTTAIITLDADVASNEIGSDKIAVLADGAYDAVGNDIARTSIALGDNVDPVLDMSVERGDSDSVLDITVESSEQLSSLDLDIDTESTTAPEGIFLEPVFVEDVFPGVSDNSETELTIENFSATENDDGSYTYETTYDAPRDGEYELSASGQDGAGNSGFDFVDVVVDEKDPSVTDAYIVNANGGGTAIAVSFDEPVVEAFGETPTFTVGGTEADVVRTQDNVVVLRAPANFQTGDSPEVSYESGELFEAHGDGDTPQGSTVVHTTKLDLDEGQNFVSVPAASGTLDVSELESQVGSDNIEVIWTYESGSWESYNPDASENDFTELEGGQGYIVTLNSEAVADVNVNNVPTGGSAEEATPGAQSLSEGWNLVGHWQEGVQPQPVALDTIESLSDATAIYAQDGTGYQYQTLDRAPFVPGEAYWVFVEDDEVYTEAEYPNEGPGFGEPVRQVD
ncbi:surface glycoprotein [Haloarcula salinisoli]|uniref:Surface glycoprotein n=1 Tax=Haloarcula salinisoli TaxID=2487746 RepID=A0A8J8C8D3_9EURY|nr:surface glycoprotein [Halomicroarcula salinisoli]MBX0304286.1 surface glycoprotein [Halomicroarcula salinisoli]